jgi:hypothetical protein
MKSLPRKAGSKTAEFGLWLTRELKEYPQYQVYYDHGDPHKYDNVKVIKAFLGDRVSRENKLADVDVLVANQDNEVLLLIEIEESPISPKILLGDVFASMLCEKFAVNIKGKQKYFEVTANSKLVVAGFLPNLPDKQIDIVKVIQGKLKESFSPQGKYSWDRVDLIVAQDLEFTIQRMQTMVLEYLT